MFNVCFFFVATKAEAIENEIQNEKMMLQKIETETLTLKYETKIQYLDAEIETYRSKIKKLIKVCLFLIKMTFSFIKLKCQTF